MDIFLTGFIFVIVFLSEKKEKKDLVVLIPNTKETGVTISCYTAPKDQIVPPSVTRNVHIPATVTGISCVCLLSMLLMNSG